MISPDFGPYRLVELLAAGDRAHVYRATDRRHADRVVALKIFSPAVSADPDFRSRFRRDATALSALHEPHVVPVHTYGELNGSAFLDMRLAEGRSLAELRRPGRLSPERAAAISRQISDGLAAVAAGGLGPRAVEPAEVLVSGAPGSEFVQLVGLGRPPVAGHDPAELVGPTGGGVAVRRWWSAAAVAAVVALVVVVGVVVSPRARPDLPPGALTALVGSEILRAAAATEVDGRSLLVGVLPDGRLRTWDLTTGDLAGPDIDASTTRVATAEVDGAPVAVTRDSDQVVRAHRLPDGRQLGPAVGAPQAADPTRPALQSRAAVPAVLAGRPVVVLPELVDPAARITELRLGYRVRSLTDDAAVGPLVSLPAASLSENPETAVLDGRPVVVTTSDEGNKDKIGAYEHRVLRTFDLATGAPVGAPLEAGAGITQLRVAVVGGQPVAVLGCSDNAVRLVDLRTMTVAAVLTGHKGAVRQLLVAEVGSRTVAVSEAGSAVSEIRFWDLATRTATGPVLLDHPARGSLLAASRTGGRTVLVALDGSTDRSDTVGVWDLATLIDGGGS